MLKEIKRVLKSEPGLWDIKCGRPEIKSHFIRLIFKKLKHTIYNELSVHLICRFIQLT